MLLYYRKSLIKVKWTPQKIFFSGREGRLLLTIGVKCTSKLDRIRPHADFFTNWKVFHQKLFLLLVGKYVVIALQERKIPSLIGSKPI